MKKWMIGLACIGMAATAAWGQYVVDFEGAGETKTAYASATISLSGMNWDMTDSLIGTSADDWKNGARSARMRGYGTSSMTMLEDLAGGIGTLSFNYRRYGTATQVDWLVEYSTDGGTSWTQVGDVFTAPASDDVQTFSETINSSGNTRIRIKRATETGAVNRQLNIDDITMTSGGPATFGVTFNQADGFEVYEGTGGSVTATAANGVAPYGYSWQTTLGVGEYSTDGALFTILPAAGQGAFSATVVATDSDTPAKIVTNSINFSVAAAPVSHDINVTPGVNGTVSTMPTDQASAGTLVTITATPDSGYAVGAISVVGQDSTPIAVAANVFEMPDQPVTVTVTFVEASTSGALIISQYYEGASNNKWIEIYNPSSGTVDLPGGSYRLGQWNGTNREGWKLGYPPSSSIALSNSIAAGATFLVMNNSAVLPAYAVANQMGGTTVMGFNGDDSVVLYTGTTYEFANVVDAVGLTGNTAVDTSYVRKNTITTGVNTDFNAADWDVFSLTQVEDALPGTNERLGYHSTGAAVFSVGLNKSNGFTVEQGSSDTVTATAANGTAPYGYAWSTTMGVGDYSTDGNVFTILSTAALGNYSATVTATDAALATASNSVTFSVVAPPAVYGIVITPPVNGAVTTTPVDEAPEGSTVTIQATPDSGYAVDTITVTDFAMNPVAVVGTAFTMPSADVIVTVTFMEHEAPDALIDFESGTLSTAYADNTALLEDGKTWATRRVVRGNLDNDKKAGTYSARMYPVTTTNAYLQQSEAYAEPITKISFWVASYGTDNMANVVLLVQVSTDGENWQTVKTLEGTADITASLVEHVITAIPEDAVYVRFFATAEAATNKRINLDDIGIFFGEPALGVSVNKTNGFIVDEGSSDTITATAANGTPPYAYVWGSTLGGAFYTTNGNVFTILATAPTGSYSATVTVTDATLATAQRVVTFSVVGVNPDDPHVTITGDLTGTVNEPINLVIALVNAVADDWFLDLRDPSNAEVLGFSFDGNNFSFTPSQVGTYVLTATAVDGSMQTIAFKAQNLVVSLAVADPPIASVTLAMDGSGDFSFGVPAGYNLVRVEGAGTTLLPTGEFNWVELSAPGDYTVVGSTVRILTSANTVGRMVRVWVAPQ